jgi:penicillin-binding protein 1C
MMLALHRGLPSRQPPRPAGVESRGIAFADNIEPPRAELFLHGTAQARIGNAPAAARRPRIVSPVAGTVYALDPDIPVNSQRIRIATVGAVSGEHLQLDNRDLGLAEGAPMVLPGPGAHRLALVDNGGHVLDRSLFTVR